MKQSKTIFEKAGTECVSFLSEGYCLMFKYYDNKQIYIKLKHYTNGNVITITSENEKVVISKNNKVIKQI